MATINTMDDLFEHLRNDPKWKEELRKIALTTKLADLPQKFAEFVEESWERMDTSDARFDDFVNRIFAEFVEETRTRMDTSDTKFDDLAEEMRARMDTSDARFDDFVNRIFAEFVEETRTHNADTDAKFDDLAEEMRARMDTSDAKFDDFVEETRTHNTATDATIKDMQDDIGELKGSNAINAAMRMPDLIAFALSEEMRYQKTLSALDLVDMTRARPEVVPQDVRMSFLEADLVIHAKDDNGEDHYIAAEVSYTVGSRDVDRAVRNSDFLRRLTGKQAHAMVVGNELNGTASMIIERDGIPWYQLRRGDTRPN